MSVLRGPLVGFFARRTSYDQAEDLAQVVHVRISRALPTIEPLRADRFVITVACNLLRAASAQRARDQRRWAPVEMAQAAATMTAADRRAEYAELARAVMRVSQASLPPSLRDVILGLVSGETPAEIAARLGLNPVTVRTRLMRARAILQKELAPYLDLAGGASMEVDEPTGVAANR